MSEDDSEEDKQKIERWTESIGPRIADAIAHELDSEKVRQLVDHVSTRAVSLALWNLEDIGYCSFDFHLSAAEFRADGTCDSCGKRRTSHHLVFVCDYPEDPQEFESVEHPRRSASRATHCTHGPSGRTPTPRGCSTLSNSCGSSG